jgi:hypothetical protein
LGEFVLFDLSDLDDIRLSVDGVLLFFEILTSYFDEKDIVSLRKYMHNLNECRKYDYSIDQSIKATRTPILKQWIKEWNKMMKENNLNGKRT